MFTGEDVKNSENKEQSNIIDEEGAIRTYTGLSIATQERIKRYVYIFFFIIFSFNLSHK